MKLTIEVDEVLRQKFFRYIQSDFFSCRLVDWVDIILLQVEKLP